MHKLLERQLRKYFPESLDSDMADKNFLDFCRAIEQAYVAHDDDRQLLERALEVSSRELTEKNQDLQRARTLAETASKAKSSFLANMSHEMRTPLNAIIGYSELIIEELSELNHEEIAIELDKIRTSGNHLLGLINNVLDLAKIESGHMEVNLEEFDLAVLVKETCTILQSQALKNSNRLEFSVDCGTSKIVSDRGKVKQILINLAGNALKFTHNGSVTLSIFEPAPGRLAISVRDTGVGMNPEKLAKLFQPFVQADNDTQKKFGGTGLGLAISAKFAELMDAAIAVESVEGQGTVFTLTLNSRVQAEKPRLQLAPHHHARDSESRSDVERRILLIDDDPTAIDLMRRFLGRHGFECISLKSGLHAVDEAVRIQPVAVLLDVFMPDMDGWTTLSRLKENPVTADIPVIFTTMTDERSLGLSLGALDYFTKPIDWGRLAAVLDSIEPTTDKAVVLLTESDSPSKNGLVSFFEHNGWEVVEASHTQAFKKIVSESRFDLVIVDCLNPEIDAPQCINALRDCPVNKATAVLCFTSRSDGLQDPELLKGGVKVVLTDHSLDSAHFENSIYELLASLRKVPQK